MHPLFRDAPSAPSCADSICNLCSPPFVSPIETTAFRYRTSAGSLPLCMQRCHTTQFPVRITPRRRPRGLRPATRRARCCMQLAPLAELHTLPYGLFVPHSPARCQSGACVTSCEPMPHSKAAPRTRAAASTGSACIAAAPSAGGGAAVAGDAGACSWPALPLPLCAAVAGVAGGWPGAAAVCQGMSLPAAEARCAAVALAAEHAWSLVAAPHAAAAAVTACTSATHSAQPAILK